MYVSTNRHFLLQDASFPVKSKNDKKLSKSLSVPSLIDPRKDSLNTPAEDFRRHGSVDELRHRSVDDLPYTSDYVVFIKDQDLRSENNELDDTKDSTSVVMNNVNLSYMVTTDTELRPSVSSVNVDDSQYIQKSSEFNDEWVLMQLDYIDEIPDYIATQKIDEFLMADHPVRQVSPVPQPTALIDPTPFLVAAIDTTQPFPKPGHSVAERDSVVAEDIAPSLNSSDRDTIDKVEPKGSSPEPLRRWVSSPRLAGGVDSDYRFRSIAELPIEISRSHDTLLKTGKEDKDTTGVLWSGKAFKKRLVFKKYLIFSDDIEADQEDQALFMWLESRRQRSRLHYSMNDKELSGDLSKSEEDLMSPLHPHFLLNNYIQRRYAELIGKVNSDGVSPKRMKYCNDQSVSKLNETTPALLLDHDEIDYKNQTNISSLTSRQSSKDNLAQTAEDIKVVKHFSTFLKSESEEESEDSTMEDPPQASRSSIAEFERHEGELSSSSDSDEDGSNVDYSSQSSYSVEKLDKVDGCSSLKHYDEVKEVPISTQDSLAFEEAPPCMSNDINFTDTIDDQSSLWVVPGTGLVTELASNVETDSEGMKEPVIRTTDNTDTIILDSPSPSLLDVSQSTPATNKTPQMERIVRTMRILNKYKIVPLSDYRAMDKKLKEPILTSNVDLIPMERSMDLSLPKDVPSEYDNSIDDAGRTHNQGNQLNLDSVRQYHFDNLDSMENLTAVKEDWISTVQVNAIEEENPNFAYELFDHIDSIDNKMNDTAGTKTNDTTGTKTNDTTGTKTNDTYRNDQTYSEPNEESIDNEYSMPNFQPVESSLSSVISDQDAYIVFPAKDYEEALPEQYSWHDEIETRVSSSYADLAEIIYAEYPYTTDIGEGGSFIVYPVRDYPVSLSLSERDEYPVRDYPVSLSLSERDEQTGSPTGMSSTDELNMSRGNISFDDGIVGDSSKSTPSPLPTSEHHHQTKPVESLCVNDKITAKDDVSCSTRVGLLNECDVIRGSIRMPNHPIISLESAQERPSTSETVPNINQTSPDTLVDRVKEPARRAASVVSEKDLSFQSRKKEEPDSPSVTVAGPDINSASILRIANQDAPPSVVSEKRRKRTFLDIFCGIKDRRSKVKDFAYGESITTHSTDVKIEKKNDARTPANTKDTIVKSTVEIPDNQKGDQDLYHKMIIMEDYSNDRNSGGFKVGEDLVQSSAISSYPPTSQPARSQSETPRGAALLLTSHPSSGASAIVSQNKLMASHHSSSEHGLADQGSIFTVLGSSKDGSTEQATDELRSKLSVSTNRTTNYSPRPGLGSSSSRSSGSCSNSEREFTYKQESVLDVTRLSVTAQASGLSSSDAPIAMPLQHFKVEENEYALTNMVTGSSSQDPEKCSSVDDEKHHSPSDGLYDSIYSGNHSKQSSWSTDQPWSLSDVLSHVQSFTLDTNMDTAAPDQSIEMTF